MSEFEELKDLLSGLTEDKVVPQADQLKEFADVIAGLEGAMVELSHSHIRVGYSMELCRLLCSMIGRILVNKNIITEEEYKDTYSKEVVEPLRQQQELLKQKVEEHEETTKEKTKEVSGEAVESSD